MSDQPPPQKKRRSVPPPPVWSADVHARWTSASAQHIVARARVGLAPAIVWPFPAAALQPPVIGARNPLGVLENTLSAASQCVASDGDPLSAAFNPALALALALAVTPPPLLPLPQTPREIIVNSLDAIVTSLGETLSLDHASPEAQCVIASMKNTVAEAMLLGRVARWSATGGRVPIARNFLNYFLLDLSTRVARKEFAATSTMLGVLTTLANALGRELRG